MPSSSNSADSAVPDRTIDPLQLAAAALTLLGHDPVKASPRSGAWRFLRGGASLDITVLQSPQGEPMFRVEGPVAKVPVGKSEFFTRALATNDRFEGLGTLYVDHSATLGDYLGFHATIIQPTIRPIILAGLIQKLALAADAAGGVLLREFGADVAIHKGQKRARERSIPDFAGATVEPALSPSAFGTHFAASSPGRWRIERAESAWCVDALDDSNTVSAGPYVIHLSDVPPRLVHVSLAVAGFSTSPSTAEAALRLNTLMGGVAGFAPALSGDQVAAVEDSLVLQGAIPLGQDAPDRTWDLLASMRDYAARNVPGLSRSP